MAHVIPSCGDNYHRFWNTFAKVPAAAYTTPAVGDLVKADTSIANAVNLCGDEDNPYGIVDSINSNNGTLTVTEFNAGCTIELPYSGALVLGDSIEVGSEAGSHGTTLDRSIVQRENTGGVGLVIAVDADTPHGTGHAVVRFA